MSELATLDEVADRFRVTKTTIRNWVRTGRIPEGMFFKIGRAYRFRLDLLEKQLFGEADASQEAEADANVTDPVVKQTTEEPTDADNAPFVMWEEDETGELEYE